MEHVALLLLAGLGAPDGAFAQTGGEAVRFPGPGVELVGRLYRPESRGPNPAIVMLHGCSGMWRRDGEPNRTYAFWAEHFARRGYVTLLVDSFGPRGQREICTQGDRAVSATRDRPRDARAAAAWLASRPEVRADAIHLMGWSNGGVTVLRTVEAVPGQPSPFRSAVALYPGCRSALSRPFVPTAPLLILAGEADDWTPAAQCQALASRAEGRQPVEIEVYPGAHHAFDLVEGAVRHRPDVRNLASPTGRGATVGPHPEARAAAVARATEFIERDR